MFSIPTIDMVKTGQNIVRLREKQGLSVKDLQDIFGFTTPQAIYKWQHGTTLPTVDNLIVLATIFHIHIDDILVVDNVADASETKVSEDLKNNDNAQMKISA
ncbi:MAG: helix-turn-helix transcriptional regulator [Lachnospiraceae bacterium]|nr:helix-turn-helix transcriptional regulator [Lachnospiraceae bacterium]